MRDYSKQPPPSEVLLKALGGGEYDRENVTLKSLRTDPGSWRSGTAAVESYQAEVEGRMRAGEPFRRVENVINQAEITEDEKAALWLLAWSMRERSAQQEEARAILAQFR
jgi:hypothetical protein